MTTGWGWTGWFGSPGQPGIPAMGTTPEDIWVIRSWSMCAGKLCMFCIMSKLPRVDERLLEGVVPGTLAFGKRFEPRVLMVGALGFETGGAFETFGGSGVGLLRNEFAFKSSKIFGVTLGVDFGVVNRDEVVGAAAEGVDFEKMSLFIG